MFISQHIREQFPEAWIRNGHPLDAAIALGLQPAEAWEVSRALMVDPEVNAAREELLKKHGLEYFLPTQIELASEILTQARRSKDENAKLRFYEFYAQLRWFENPAEISASNGKSVNILVRRTGAKMIETKAVQ